MSGDDRKPYRNTQPPVALTIAGSDSGGGAGIQADLKTFADLGVHGTCAITALTAQNTCGVHGVHTISADFLQAQIDAVLGDYTVSAIKTGMLANRALITATVSILANYPTIPLVADPVMVATSGASLLDSDAVECLREKLIPAATLITPNIPEAEVLLGQSIGNLAEMREAADALLKLGCRGVVLKGGHLTGAEDAGKIGAEVVDLLVTSDQVRECRHPRLNLEAHGTGCTLAAALAAELAKGTELIEAFERASDYVARVLQGGFSPGRSDIRVLAHGLTKN